MRIALLWLASWAAVSFLMALSWAIGARVGYRRAIDDVRQQASEATGTPERSISLDDIDKLVS